MDPVVMLPQPTGALWWDTQNPRDPRAVTVIGLRFDQDGTYAVFIDADGDLVTDRAAYLEFDQLKPSLEREREIVERFA